MTEAHADVTVRLAETEADYRTFVELLREYVDELAEYDFYDLGNEYAAPAERYGPPSGAAWLSFGPDGMPTGIIAVRDLDGIAEIKRLYVRPEARGSGAGRLLCDAAIQRSRAAGYRSVRLDSTERLAPAVRLYERLGFSRIPAYNDNPEFDAVFFELRL